MVICLERGADLHMAQLMPLPVTVSLASVKSRLVLPFWYRLTRVVPVCVRVCFCMLCVVVHCRAAVSKSSTAAAAAGSGCYVYAPSTSSSLEMQSPQDPRRGSTGSSSYAALTQSGGRRSAAGSSRVGHEQHRPRTNTRPGYMQMTRAASVRSDRAASLDRKRVDYASCNVPEI